MIDPDELRVIHALRLKGFADTTIVAEAAEVSVSDANRILNTLETNRFVRRREGRLTGWMLLPQGRARGEELLAVDLDAAGKRPELDDLYRRFLEHNQGFLSLCTAWQTRVVDGDQIVNDHTDADYDASVIARLVETDAIMQPLCADLAALLDRFSGYGPRFATALAKVTDGDTDWFTKPVIESYHSVWFELHEDLLASLGFERAKEGSS